MNSREEQHIFYVLQTCHYNIFPSGFSNKKTYIIALIDAEKENVFPLEEKVSHASVLKEKSLMSMQGHVYHLIQIVSRVTLIL